MKELTKQKEYDNLKFAKLEITVKDHSGILTILQNHIDKQDKRIEFLENTIIKLQKSFDLR